MGLIQCVIALYCAGLATLEYNNKSSAAKRVIPEISGEPMNSGYHMPLSLLLAIIALCLSVLIPAVWRMIRNKARINSLKECKANLAESANRNLEYRAQLAEYKSELLSDSDPHVYPQFIDDRRNGSDRRELQAYFAIVNRSDSGARNIVLDSIELHGKIVQFSRQRMTASLLPKQEAYFYPDVVTKENMSVSAGWDQDLFHLFYMDYHALNDPTLCEATTVVRATYQDSAHNLFEVTCELVLDPSAHNDVRRGNRGPNPVIFTRNFKFRKLARAI